MNHSLPTLLEGDGLRTFGLPILLVLVVTIYLRQSSLSRKELKPLPGPKGLPLLGNLLQVPRTRAWLKFTEWREQYGDLIGLNVAGQDLIVIGNSKIAADLLDRRSAIYSDRPKNIVARLLTGDMVFAFSQHNDLWRTMRRGSQEALGPQITKKYCRMQEVEGLLLLGDVVKDPENWAAHLRRAAASLVIGVIYGVPPIRNYLEPDIVRVNLFVERALYAAAPGSFLVEYFTWMQYLPRWMSPWRRYAEDSFNRDSSMFEDLFAGVKKRLDAGDETPSVAADVIRDNKSLGMSDRQAAWFSATLYAAGAETTSGQVAWVIVAMILYPETMKKAQAEIDRVVGRGRLPNFSDYEHLPYIRAMVKEILRWRGVSPLAVPHRLCQDDVYDGYFIKKDTICVVNVWALNHDRDIYGVDAEDFNPDRHLDSNGKLKASVPNTHDENHHTFGFGRRICVGRHLSKNSIFMQIASLLWAFDIKSGKDANGIIVLPDAMNGINDGLVVRPPEFPCVMTPRFPEVPSLIAEAKELHGYTD
ncbi:cytochrome P450 [Dendrothele bispora CBS 962.96]|uniref:Cytochrome P450 n=1 Tax=Dendrothele bispora (strain CBS 962.96) TaxID=1314807 RepID=A0A4S8LAI4_DENBC|nr:cytochrome P450 [Dendrothele bispora CBS 962.96]